MDRASHSKAEMQVRILSRDHFVNVVNFSILRVVS